MSEPAGIETTDQAGPGVVYQGHIGIEWPAKRDTSLILPGWGCRVWDALSGLPITTVTALAVRATANGLVTADVTMFADEDGQPVYQLARVQHPETGWHEKVPAMKDGRPREETFAFLVAEMRVRQAERESGVLEPKFTAPDMREPAGA